MKKKLCAAMLALLMVGSSVHAQGLLNETQEQKDKRMEWFYKAKLGIFIHWLSQIINYLDNIPQNCRTFNRFKN